VFIHNLIDQLLNDGLENSILANGLLTEAIGALYPFKLQSTQNEINTSKAMLWRHHLYGV
jgi:hypothetical protein